MRSRRGLARLQVLLLLRLLLHEFLGLLLMFLLGLLLPGFVGLLLHELLMFIVLLLLKLLASLLLLFVELCCCWYFFVNLGVAGVRRRGALGRRNVVGVNRGLGRCITAGILWLRVTIVLWRAIVFGGWKIAATLTRGNGGTVVECARLWRCGDRRFAAIR